MARRNRRGFGALRKLPSGKWQASYLSPSGERKQAPMTFGAWIDADAYLSSVRYEMEKGIWVDGHENPADEEQSENLKFGNYAMRHIELQTTSNGEQLRLSTKATYKRILKNHLGKFANRPIDSITKPEVDEWFMELLKSGKRTTASKAYKLLSAVLSRAVSDGLLTKNPCAIKGAQSATSGKEIVCPTPEEVALLANHINPRYKAIVIVSAYAGLRFGEMTELRVKDVTRIEEAGVASYKIKVSRAVTLVDGEFVKGKPKSKKSSRTIHISSSVTPILDTVMKEREPYGANTLLFPAANGMNLRGDVFAKAFERAKVKSGVNKKGLSHHSLRHFGGTYLAAAGGNLADVQEWLGDSSVEAAIRYMHATGRSKSLVENMPKYLES